MNCKLHLFDKQGDKAKALALENSIDAHEEKVTDDEEEVTDDEIVMSTNPMKAIRKLKFKETKKTNSLVLIEPQTDKIKGEIKTLLQ